MNQQVKNNVRHLGATNTMTVEQALDSAKQADLEEVLIVGYNTDGELVVLSSRMNRRDALWLMECGKDYVMNGAQD